MHSAPARAATEIPVFRLPVTLPDTDAQASGLTRQEWVYRQLRAAILGGHFVPGRSVTLRGIAGMLGTSLTPVREAIRRLVAERALVAHGNRRVSVPRMTPAKLDELCAVRASLEVMAAERSLPLQDAARLQRLWALNAAVDEAIAAGDVTAYLGHHREFHYMLCGVEQPGAVVRPLLESLWLQFSPFLRLVLAHIGVDYVIDRHVEALRAIERGDVAALRFALEADIREGLGSITESDWKTLDCEG